MRVIWGIYLTIWACLAADAQPGNASPTFDAASVKPAPPPTAAILNHINTGGPGTPYPGRVDWWSVSMTGFLMEAYDVKPFQISGPDWLGSTKFQLTATVPKGATKEQYRLMLQNLLAERFKIKVHFEKKEGTSYALVTGKNGPKMKESVEEPAPQEGAAAAAPLPPAKLQKDQDGFPACPPGRGARTLMANGRVRLCANQVTMERLAALLTNWSGHTVTDETGLKGRYDFVLTYAPAGTPAAGATPAPDGSTASVPEVDSYPDLVGAMQQLGLKLEQKRAMIDMLVIDHLEKVPTEN
jgi:uncharacterized protein (TIGR03435 family)